MPNSIGPTGLTTATQAELLAQYTDAFQTIYGADINLDSSTPDGQMINIFIQSILDILDFLTQIYNNFDPDKALGVVLDSRVAYNGIQREAGTFTITNVTVITTQSLTLPGLDQTVVTPYTVADAAGNQWELIATQNPSAAGTYVYAFQAAVPGAVLTTPNTITVPVSIVLGVDSFNNPTTYTTLGINEETDAALKIRRQKSVSIGSQGYLAGLLAALENINGLVSAQVYENNTGSTDIDGVPSHSIWVIVSGTGSTSDIANAIYNKRNAGCGMFGTQTFIITQKDGSPFVVKWDNVIAQNLFIKFNSSSLDGVNPPNVDLILQQLPIIFTPGVGSQVNINDLATLVQEIDPNTLVTNAGFSVSAGGTYTNTLSPSAKNKQFVILGADTFSTSIAPFAVSVVHGGNTQTFVATDGRPSYTFALVSGLGSIDSSTGVYTSAGTGTDVVSVTDSIGTVAFATITVT